MPNKATSPVLYTTRGRHKKFRHSLATTSPSLCCKHNTAQSNISFLNNENTKVRESDKVNILTSLTNTYNGQYPRHLLMNGSTMPLDNGKGNQVPVPENTEMKSNKVSQMCIKRQKLSFTPHSTKIKQKIEASSSRPPIVKSLVSQFISLDDSLMNCDIDGILDNIENEKNITNTTMQSKHNIITSPKNNPKNRICRNLPPNTSHLSNSIREAYISPDKYQLKIRKKISSNIVTKDKIVKNISNSKLEDDACKHVSKIATNLLASSTLHLHTNNANAHINEEAKVRNNVHSYNKKIEAINCVNFQSEDLNNSLLNKSDLLSVLDESFSNYITDSSVVASNIKTQSQKSKAVERTSPDIFADTDFENIYESVEFENDVFNDFPLGCSQIQNDRKDVKTESIEISKYEIKQTTVILPKNLKIGKDSHLATTNLESYDTNKSAIPTINMKTKMTEANISTSNCFVQPSIPKEQMLKQSRSFDHSIKAALPSSGHQEVSSLPLKDTTLPAITGEKVISPVLVGILTYFNL